jgi:hypothetical protein
VGLAEAGVSRAPRASASRAARTRRRVRVAHATAAMRGGMHGEMAGRVAQLRRTNESGQSHTRPGNSHANVDVRPRQMSERAAAVPRQRRTAVQQSNRCLSPGPYASGWPEGQRGGCGGGRRGEETEEGYHRDPATTCKGTATNPGCGPSAHLHGGGSHVQHAAAAEAVVK